MTTTDYRQRAKPQAEPRAPATDSPKEIRSSPPSSIIYPLSSPVPTTGAHTWLCTLVQGKSRPSPDATPPPARYLCAMISGDHRRPISSSRSVHRRAKEPIGR